MYQLTINGLCKVFSNSKSPHVVLNDLSFTVEMGEFLSIVGPSGCGKTTLLNIIAGFSHASGGQVLADDRVITSPGPDRAFVFQDYALFPWMTVKDNILYPMKRQGLGREARQARLRELLSLAKLDGKENLYPHQLSGGMKQRTSVIRALACRPRVLLMDEPLGAVDVNMRRKLQEELESIFMKDPVTVIMVTHDIDEAVFFSDRVMVMSEGGHVLEDLHIGLDRPRNRRGADYHQALSRLMDVLESVPQADERDSDVASTGSGRVADKINYAC